jgi:hypothetical protein
VCSAGKPGTGKSMKIPAFMQIAIYETTYSYMTYHIYIIYIYIYYISHIHLNQQETGDYISIGFMMATANSP